MGLGVWSLLPSNLVEGPCPCEVPSDSFDTTSVVFLLYDRYSWNANL